MNSISDVFKAVEAGRTRMQQSGSAEQARELIQEAQRRQQDGEASAKKRAQAQAADDAEAAAALLAVVDEHKKPARAKKKKPASGSLAKKMAGRASTKDASTENPLEKQAGKKQVGQKKKSTKKKKVATAHRRRQGAVTTHAPVPAPAAGLALERQRPGMVTRGAEIVWCGVQRGCYRVTQSSASTWLLASVIAMSLVLLAIAPRFEAPAAQGVDFIGQDNPPASAAREWLLGYGGIYDVLADPSQERLQGLSAHLIAQPEIAEVFAVRPRWSRTGQRLLEVEADLREAAYHVLLADGTKRYIARDGVLLPIVMPAPPAGAPQIRRLAAAGPEAFAFADALWQELLATDTSLAAQFPIIDLHWPLQHPLAAQQEFGVAFITQHGAPFLLGRADEIRYGHGVKERVADLVHLLRCQGDPSTLAGAQLRFPQPRAMLARSPAEVRP
jgi:hypothetical protein